MHRDPSFPEVEPEPVLYLGVGVVAIVVLDVFVALVVWHAGPEAHVHLSDTPCAQCLRAQRIIKCVYSAERRVQWRLTGGGNEAQGRGG